jgi:CelD/BcsL family acetyltransferase involved in cellulose biosynthesis
LVRVQRGNTRVITFADLGVSDYNGPVVARRRTLPPAAALWKAIRSALPPADHITLEKMPRDIDGVANPLVQLAGARPSRLNGNIIIMGASWEAYLKSLERTVRKELGRSWRVFERHDGARFERVTDKQRAREVLGALERLQSERIRDLGLAYSLDDAATADLYRRMTDAHLSDGRVMLTALVAGDVVVAALLAIADKERYAMVRLGASGGEWRTCSPGRLVIERTMHALHTEGRRSFDFTTGDYAYKRRLGVTSIALFEVTKMLSPRGLAPMLAARAKGSIRRYPRLSSLVRPRTDTRVNG